MVRRSEMANKRRSRSDTVKRLRLQAAEQLAGMVVALKDGDAPALAAARKAAQHFLDVPCVACKAKMTHDVEILRGHCYDCEEEEDGP